MTQGQINFLLTFYIDECINMSNEIALNVKKKKTDVKTW